MFFCLSFKRLENYIRITDFKFDERNKQMKKQTILTILTFLPLISEIICMFFLPMAIPIHYNADLHVIQYGVKYMLLLVGVMVVVFGIFIKMIYKSSVNTDRETIVYRLSAIALLVFNVINLFALGNAFLRTWHFH